MNSYNVIGIMSGTSLDGLDIAYCKFDLDKNNKWSFKINSSTTILYDKNLLTKLSFATQMNGLDLMKLHNELGNFIGKSVNHFIKDNNLNKKEIDCISSHGHTIFHQPEIQLTTQIGNGANISSLTKLPVICDFRTSDIALGGQGAPLVPVGDKLLFSDYDFCINIGGIANISIKNNAKAFDICPANIVLNKLANELDLAYDNEGKIADSGKLNNELLNKLNQLQYYSDLPPKSLGIEWIENNIFPIINSYKISPTDKLKTFSTHIAMQISNYINVPNTTVFITGGGTFNTFLINQIKQHSKSQIIIPPTEIINFKEALIFAFLGVLRLRNETNCLSSVTGAIDNSIGGCIYDAFK